MNNAGGCIMPIYDIQRCLSSSRVHLLPLQEYVVFLSGIFNQLRNWVIKKFVTLKLDGYQEIVRGCIKVRSQ